MNKLWITLICVFLAVLIIGCVIYPESDMQGTIDGIKNDYAILFYTFNFVSNTLKKLIPKNITPSNTINSLEAYENIYLNNLENYIPYYIESNNLSSRCTNQGLSVYTEKLNIHTEHKVCNFTCFNVWDLDFFEDFSIPESEEVNGIELKIYYCAVCSDIVAISAKMFEPGYNPNSIQLGSHLIYTCEDLESDYLYPWWRVTFSSGRFDWNDVKNYSS